MKNIFVGSFFLAAAALTCHGQINNPWTQYNQVPYLQNAAHSGIEGYTDIKVGFKKQWASFSGAPKTYFLGANHSVDINSGGVSGSTSTPVKLGFSGYVAKNVYNAINDTQVGLAHAVHIPVTNQYYLSMGISGSYNRLRAEPSEVIARDQSDPMYQSLMSNFGVLNYFNLDAGVVLYSTKLYVGYSTQRLVRSRINSDIPGNEKSSLRHVALLGYNHTINEKWELQPGLLYRHESSLKDLYNISLKARYNAAVWGGLSYSPGEAVSFMAGYKISSYLAISYSYDASVGSTSKVSNGNHEVIIAIMPFNKKNQPAIFW